MLYLRRFYLAGVERFYLGSNDRGWIRISKTLALAAGVDRRGNLYTQAPLARQERRMDRGRRCGRAGKAKRR